MIELPDIARTERLAAFLRQPWMQAFNGVEGVALSYDDRLVGEVGRQVGHHTPTAWHGTIEHSREVAALLAYAAWRIEVDQSPKDDRSYPWQLGNRLVDWWYRTAKRSGDLHASPIVVEVAAREGFGHVPPPRPADAAKSHYRWRIRRSRGARLQVAASGGRIDAHPPLQPNRHGTLGGFLVDGVSGASFAVTAAHVCRQSSGRARPLPWPSAPSLIRFGTGLVLGVVGGARYRRENCPFHWNSPPSMVSIDRCTAEATPETEGLDVALLRVAPQARLQQVGVAALADMSPILDLGFIGATSGRQRVRVTSFSLWHSYALDGRDLCIHNCVQIKLAERPYVRTDVSQGGDSGAWLLASGRDGLHWTGLLTGGDGDTAGFVPAPRIVGQVESELGFAVSAWV